jgi:hypothetical protein
MRLPGLDRVNRSVANLPKEAPPESDIVLLVITSDPGLYARIHEITSVWKWTILHQTEPVPQPDSDAPAIVILDRDLAGVNWKEALMSIRASGHDSCILLASRVFDPYLWDEVVRCGGFDVITRSDGREHLMSVLRFAWFWRTTGSHDLSFGPRLSTSQRR